MQTQHPSQDATLQAAIEQEKKNRQEGGKWLKEQAKYVRLHIAFATLWGVFGGIATIIFAGCLATALHDILSNQLNLQAVYGLLFSGAFRAFFFYLQQRAGYQASATIRTKLRQELLCRFDQAGPAELKQSKTGELVTIALERIEALHGYYCNFLPQSRLIMITPLMMIGVAFWLDWIVGTIFLLTCPLVPLFMALVGRGAASESEKQFAILTRMSGHFLDRIQGLTTIQIFNQGAKEEKLIEENADLFRRGTMRVLRLAFLSSAVLEFFASISVAGVAVYIGLSLLNLISFGTADQMTLYKGLFLLVIAPEFYQPLRQLAAYYHDRASAIGAAAALKPWFDRQEFNRPPQIETYPNKITSLTMSALTFQWENADPLFENVTFTAKQGDVLVIAGESGIGKSTFLNILTGYLPAQAATLTLNDAPQESYTLPRDSFSLLSQKTHIFAGSLRDNILIGHPTASEADVQHAIEISGLRDVIHSLPEGVDTIVGEKGAGLSGGQAQRVGIARAFLRQSDILILDEPTAGLDPYTEAEILSRIKELSQDKIVIMATHSHAAMALATQLLTLEDATLKPLAMEDLNA